MDSLDTSYYYLQPKEHNPDKFLKQKKVGGKVFFFTRKNLSGGKKKRFALPTFFLSRASKLAFFGPRSFLWAHNSTKSTPKNNVQSAR